MLKINFIVIFCISAFAACYSQSDSAKNADSLLLLQIQGQLGQQQTPPSQPRTAASANPDISVIGDFRGLYRSYGYHNFDAVLHETEFSFQSVVDPYARADFFYSIGEDEKTGTFSGEIEEGTLKTLSLPAHLQLKVGRFKQQIGRVNPIHGHALPFVDMPDAYVNFFGEEGLKGDGGSLSWLLPNRVFYQELTVEATNVTPESPSFERSRKNNFLYLAHLKNFWDLTANATLELGLSDVSGENLLRKITNVSAVDLTYKWKPIRYNTYKSVTFQNEFYYSQAMLDSGKVNAIGFYSLLNVQIAKRTFIAGRYDYSNRPNSAQFVQQSGSVTWGWYATEFQKIEVEGKYTTMNERLPENNDEKNCVMGYLRWIFVIGTHGAHQY
jgi:hypothetical protein